MSEVTRSSPLTSAADAALMFPTLSPAQIARLSSHGVVRPITRGEVLIEAGQTNVPFFVVKAGEIEIIRPSSMGDLLVAFHRPGQFTGEASMLLGRPAMMRVRASETGEVIQLTRDQMHGLIQTDADISEVLMRALIHRRSQLVAQGIGDVMVIGSGKSSASSAATTSLSENMSRYLIRRIEETATIQVRTRTEIVALEGNGHLERVHWRDGTGAVTSHDIKHVFLMTGAGANASWLNGRVVLDEKGFIKTGPDLTQKDLAAARWPLDRSPYVLETSHPGVFAVGDVRCGNIKRVASAVGEGSIAVSFVHRVLAEYVERSYSTSQATAHT